MRHRYQMRTLIVRALVSGGIAAAGVGLSTGPAQAAPLGGGPWTWCPGDPLDGAIHTATGRGSPPPGTDWDTSRCHTWWSVLWGHGNVGPSVWDGPDPPPAEATNKPPCGFPFMCSGTP
ncbi:hypothetical protein MKCMC460_31920 [Mycobacterium sp. 20KCMC460]|uniref:Secreted protein n=2 Tax=Mycobacteriaceae TaxID=1762 RepID=A0A9P3Q487_9MYCO|nr:hypothetical protein MKCMC460_31920 [Mycobacterium sp. 20KCMC460]GLB81452.1 hypothetical protein SRL2020028_07080 [Mycobacterium kiyosense]GLB93645.1 hypothetical protein SRL2020226_04210 [Mycobacterium kiyosense]GLD28447.1 hypothetical protein Mkiyose1413_03300 [Mycobacterium kiyosense]